jgi:uncharacterized membrane protein YbaN (DUF454 family)
MSGRVSKPRKVIYLLIGGVCLALGVIGLIIPIIPGVLFLMAAVYLLSRGSGKIKRFTDRDPRILQMQQRMEQFGEVNVADRFRLAGWMALDAAVKSVRAISTLFPRAVFSRAVISRKSRYASQRDS